MAASCSMLITNALVVKFIAVFFSVNFPIFFEILVWEFILCEWFTLLPSKLPFYQFLGHLHPPFPHISSPGLGLSCGLSSCPLVTGHIRDLVVELAKSNTVLASSLERMPCSVTPHKSNSVLPEALAPAYCHRFSHPAFEYAYGFSLY